MEMILARTKRGISFLHVVIIIWSESLRNKLSYMWSVPIVWHLLRDRYRTSLNALFCRCEINCLDKELLTETATEGKTTGGNKMGVSTRNVLKTAGPSRCSYSCLVHSAADHNEIRPGYDIVPWSAEQLATQHLNLFLQIFKRPSDLCALGSNFNLDQLDNNVSHIRQSKSNI